MDLNPLHLGQKALSETKQLASDAKHLGERAVGFVEDQIAAAIPDSLKFHPKLPPYHELTPAQRVEALRRSEGLEHPQDVIRDENGHPHEPINLTVTGTAQELMAAMKAAGWHRADELTGLSGVRTALTMVDKLLPIHKAVDYNYQASPVSDMYLDGQRHVWAFNKNNHYDFGRDHLRVFDTGQKAPDGRPIWQIAATRDTGMEIDLNARKGNHQIDHAIDHERDQVMADLLDTGRVKGWQIAQGQIEDPGLREHLTRDYTTDGAMYLVALEPDHEANRHGIGEQDHLAREIADHLPGPLRNAAAGLNQKLTDLFKGMN